MISVCMATFNGEKHIKAQLSSILAQLNSQDEVVVSDDGSTDHTIEEINSFSDPRIRLFRHVRDRQSETRQKLPIQLVAENFENGLQNCRGDVIFLADQDDLWESGRVKAVTKALESKLLVMCNFKLIDEAGRALAETGYYQTSPISNWLVVNIIRSKFLGCCMAFRRNLLQLALPFPKNLIAHDLWIGSLGARRGRYSFLLEPLHQYRRYGANVSTTTSPSRNSWVFRLKYRLIFMTQILFRIVGSLVRKARV